MTDTQDQNMQEAPKGPPRYHGFTCPECCSHEFGTSSGLPKGFFPEFPNATSVGHCQGNSYAGNGCKFKWDRADKETEDKVIYSQTPEEWAQGRIEACLPPTSELRATEIEAKLPGDITLHLEYHPAERNTYYGLVPAPLYTVFFVEHVGVSEEMPEGGGYVNASEFFSADDYDTALASFVERLRGISTYNRKHHGKGVADLLQKQDPKVNALNASDNNQN